MQINPEDYIVGLWFVKGWFREEEIDIQFIFYRHGEGQPWKIDFRTRKYEDEHVDFSKTKDKKQWYDVNLKPEQLYVSQEEIIKIAHDMAGTFSKGLNKSWWDHIIVEDLGERFGKIVMAAGKDWIHVKEVPVDSEEGEKISQRIKQQQQQSSNNPSHG